MTGYAVYADGKKVRAVFRISSEGDFVILQFRFDIGNRCGLTNRRSCSHRHWETGWSKSSRSHCSHQVLRLTIKRQSTNGNSKWVILLNIFWCILLCIFLALSLSRSPYQLPSFTSRCLSVFTWCCYWFLFFFHDLGFFFYCGWSILVFRYLSIR